MSDLQRRLQERRAALSRSKDDDAAAIRARLRTGQVSPSSLKFAALLGSSGARELLGEGAPAVDRDTATWLKDLTADGEAPEVALRVGVAAARHVLPLWERRPERCERHGGLACREPLCQVDPRLRQALERLEACVAAPTAAKVGLLLERRAELEQVEVDVRSGRGDILADRKHVSMEEVRSYGGYDERDQLGPIAMVVGRTSLAAIAVHGDVEQRRALYQELNAAWRFLTVADGAGGARDLRPDEPGWEAAWRRGAVTIASSSIAWTVGPVRSFARDDGIARRVDVSYLITERLEELRDAIKAEVLPWLLAREDPLAARVAAAR